MADEKQTTSDLDDWLEDLDDSEEFSGELDQENIDALLSGGMEPGTAEPEPAEEAQADNASVELDQSNIDALLGGNLDIEDKEEAQAEAAEDNSSVELEQANIDALLGGSDDGQEAEEAKPAEAPQNDASVELDQSNIDALLGNLEEESPGQQNASPGEQEESGSVELDQANIDLLLGDDDDLPQSADGDELGQDNIDALLSGAGNQEKEPTAGDFLVSGAAEGSGLGEGLDVDQDEIDQLFSGLDDDEAEEPFPSEEMDLADVLEGEDDFLEVGNTSQAETTSSGDTTVAGDMDDMNHEIPAHDQGAGGFLPFLPESINKTVVGAVAACLVLLIVSSLYFFGSGSEKEPAIPSQHGQPVAQMEESAPAPEPVNHVPVVNDSLYTMPETGGEVPVTLAAKDDDNDTVTYEVTTPPQYGRLSGDAPALVYLPNNDFPGEDRFEYKATDGKESSTLAKVIITGPNLAKLAEEKEKLRAAAAKIPLQPSRPEVHAENKTYDMISTDKLTIDWASIWRDANETPFNSKVFVDIDDSHLKGSLSKLADGKYVYRPDPTFSGKDVLHYRFKQGGLSSGLGRVTMRVKRGDLPPEIRLGEMAGAYVVGETVRIDASPTMDEARGKLSFRWEQISGVPVQMKKNNDEGSIITFAMPSSFYTSAEPGPVLQVTAVDAAGQSDSKVIKVRSISRRKSALWGMAENNAAQGNRVRLR